MRGNIIRSAGAALLLAAATPAIAQDKTEDWSGPYVTVSAAGENQQARASSSDPVNQVTNLIVPGRGVIVVPGTIVATSASDSRTGLSGGAAIGWLGQSGSVVYGVELGGNLGRSSTNVASVVSLPPTALTPASTLAVSRSVRKDYDWSARVRLGFATGKALIYASGGVAGTRARLTATDSFADPGGAAAPCAPGPCTIANFGPYGPAVATSSARRSLLGWTAGAGLDYKLARRVSIGIDYRHNDYGAKTIALPGVSPVNAGPTITDGSGNHPPADVGGSPGNTRLGLRDDRVAATLSFHF